MHLESRGLVAPLPERELRRRPLDKQYGLLYHSKMPRGGFVSNRLLLALAAPVFAVGLGAKVSADRTPGMPVSPVNQTTNPAPGGVPVRWVAAIRVAALDNDDASCSGFFYDDNTIATAGHCVYNVFPGSPNRRWATETGTVDVSRAAYWNGSTTVKPYGSCSVNGTPSASNTWVTAPSPPYDYGAIRLASNCTLPGDWFALSTASPSSAAASTYITGYPADLGRDIGNHFKMIKSTGQVLGVLSNPGRLCYNVSTYGGNSGSPVYQATNGVMTAYGIHNYGFASMPGCGQSQNAATRIDSTVLNSLTIWKS
jgi:glutamyl endopeptidase